MNPYDWQGHQPQVVVPRPETETILGRLLRGGGVWVLAGRGMGKSVLLRQLQLMASGQPDVIVTRISTAPPELSYRACLEKLAAALDLADEDVSDSGQLVSRFQERQEEPVRLICLFDEFDRYVREPYDVPANLAGRDFFNDLEDTRKEHRVGVLAAGGVGSFVFRDVLGSSFLSRAQKVILDVFGRKEIELLARPFAKRSGPLSQEVLDLLLLATGGSPALATYGLERLWNETHAEARKLVEIFEDFQQDQRQYLWNLKQSFADVRLSGAPERVWQLVRQADGSLHQSDLRDACRSEDLLALDFADVLDLLRAAGLVHLIGSVRADPVSVRPLSSFLNLEGPPATGVRLPERFFEDMVSTLSTLHRLSADFFRPGVSGKQLVPEATFAGVIALGLQSLGWQVEREAQYGAGRTDLKLTHPEDPDTVIVEVKIWGRHDYLKVQQQVESYWSTGIAAGAVVMLTDELLEQWPESYRQECLVAPQREIESLDVSDSPIRACWSCRSRTVDGAAMRVDHFLLRIARR